MSRVAMQGPLSGRAALVTGVSRRRGIGFAIARRLADFGANLCIHSYSPYDAEQPWGRDLDEPNALAEELRKRGSQVVHLEADFLVANE